MLGFYPLSARPISAAPAVVATGTIKNIGFTSSTNESIGISAARLRKISQAVAETIAYDIAVASSSGAVSAIQNTGWFSATSAIERYGSENWTQLENIGALDNTYAVGELSANRVTYLNLRAFDGLTVPAGSTIYGVQLRIDGYSSAPLQQAEAYLFSGPAEANYSVSNAGVDQPLSQSVSDKTRYFGGSSYRFSGMSDGQIDRVMLPADFDQDFEAVFFFVSNATLDTTIYIDSVQICVWYGPAPVVQNTGWLSPTAATELWGTWLNSNNVKALDGVYASVLATAGDGGGIHVSGFSNLNIPSNASIEGIQIRVDGYGSASAKYSYAGLYVGTINSSNYPEFDPLLSTTASDQTRYIGGATNLLGGAYDTVTYHYREWAPSDFSPSLGVELSIYDDVNDVNFNLDSVQLCVWYYTPPTSTVVGTTKSISFSAAFAEALSFAARRTRTALFSVAELEALAFNTRRTRNLSESIAETIGYNIVSKRTRGLTMPTAEAESFSAAANRVRVANLPVPETESYSSALSRGRKVSTSFAETIAHNIAASRNRGMAFSVSEAESLVQAIYRAKTLGFSIAETEALVASILKVKILAFTVAEVEALTASISRARSHNLAVLEAMAYLATASRNRKVATSVAETEANTLASLRNRGVSTSIVESEAVTVALARLKQAALALAEVTGYSFSIVKVKLLSATIIESEAFSFGALRRTRNVVEAINEVTAHAINTRRSRGVSPNVYEGEVVSAALNRVKQAQLALSETYLMASTVARRRELSTTITELESVAATLARLKVVAFVAAESESNSFFVSRARKCVVNVNELEAIQASFNRARSVVVPVGEHVQFTLNFGRLRQQLMNIGESQGVEAALNRLREVVQSVSNTTDYTFNIRVTSLDPNSIAVVVSWQEWKVEGDSIRLVNREETLKVIGKMSSDIQIVERMSADVVVYEDRSISLTVPQEQSRTCIIPNNAL